MGIILNRIALGANLSDVVQISSSSLSYGQCSLNKSSHESFEDGEHILFFHNLFIICIAWWETLLVPWEGKEIWLPVFKKEKAFFVMHKPLGAGLQIRVSLSVEGIISVWVIAWAICSKKLIYEVYISGLRQMVPEEYLGPLSGFWWYNYTHLSG
jgi:hypothetical protein